MKSGGRTIAVVACALALACSVHVVRPDARAIPPALTQEIAVQTLNLAEPVERLLRERLLARGATVVSTPGADPERLTFSARFRGRQQTTLTRLSALPWALISIASLTLIPYRQADEAEVELQLVNPRARQTERVRTARVSCETSLWIWLPFAFSPQGLSFATAKRAAEEEALRRAVDDALDELLRADPVAAAR